MYNLIIPGRLPGLNEYTEACRRNPHIGAKMKQEAQRLISYCIKQQLPHIHIHQPVRVHFRWIEKNKRRDIDNIAFAKKFIFDSLVECRIIETDGWRGVVGFTDEFEVDADDPKIIVSLEVVDG